MSGILISAPASGSGKTSVTLGLLRALRRANIRVASAKAGPDYIDPAFHTAASGHPCVNLDPWAMRPALIERLVLDATSEGEGLVVEGMMGLFDAAADGRGSSADLAALLDLSVVLVIDAAKQSHSVAALVRGFRDHRPDVALKGLVLNRVGSARHETLLKEALAPLGIPVLGALPMRADLVLPERHLGLVQASEHGDIESFADRAADWIEEGCDMAAIVALIGGAGAADRAISADRRKAAFGARRIPPLGQRIAVARDAAFAFDYPHLIDGWRAEGAEISFFSPLADEGPSRNADAVYLPGGYPELHAGKLAAADALKTGLHAAAARGAAVYGECGGYMVLGETLEDAVGTRHAMLGLLPLDTSFKTRRRHLGYRRVEMKGFPWSGGMTAHEFHYASIVREGDAERLMTARDARGEDLGAMGLRVGRIGGSFLHLIDGAE